MRNAFAAEITSLASKDKNIVLLSGDIGNKLFDKYKAAQADRFFNCGVAEQNMMGVAAGLAMEGLRPVVYTINSFLVTRAFEQIRLDICYHNLPVVLVGVGGGLGYASLGPTHHSLEDAAILRSLPNMTVLFPADPIETRINLRESLKHNGPVFIRIGKKGEPSIHDKEPIFSIGTPIPLIKGTDVCLLGTGVVMPLVMKVAQILSVSGISCQVYSVPTIKPLNEKFLTEVFGRFKIVASVEEHTLLGGFGSAVSEWVVDQQIKNILLRFGTNDEFMHEASNLDYAREKLGLSKEKMVEKIKSYWRKIN